MATPLHAYPPRIPNADPDVDLALRPYDTTDTWPGELATGGSVGWTRFNTGEDGWVEVKYPNIK
jgi:hypothetical protein